MAFITANFWLWGTQKETNVSVGHKQDVIAVVRHFSQHSTQFFQDATWEMKSRVVRAWALSLYFGGPFPVRHPAPLHVLVPWGSLIEETSFWWILQGVKWQSEDMNSSGNYLPHPPEHMSCWAHLPAKSCWIHLHKEQCCFCFQARLKDGHLGSNTVSYELSVKGKRSLGNKRYACQVPPFNTFDGFPHWSFLPSLSKCCGFYSFGWRQQLSPSFKNQWLICNTAPMH